MIDNINGKANYHDLQGCICQRTALGDADTTLIFIHCGTLNLRREVRRCGLNVAYHYLNTLNAHSTHFPLDKSNNSATPL
jgi:hypothetical protein